MVEIIKDKDMEREYNFGGGGSGEPIERSQWQNRRNNQSGCARMCEIMKFISFLTPGRYFERQIKLLRVHGDDNGGLNI